jgi:hypothetical protein
MRYRCLFLVSMLPLCLMAAPSRAASVLMFVNDSANRLLTVDITTWHVDRVGTTDAQLTDIAFGPDERLLGITSSYLYEIRPWDGSSVLIGNHGFGEPGHSFAIDALTFGPDGLLYGAGNDALITIDPMSGTGTWIGHLSGHRSAGDLGVDARGRLLLTTDDGLLLHVDPRGGGAQTVGSLPYTDLFAFAGTTDGRLYGIRSTNEVVVVDPDTGQASYIGQLEGDFLLGYAWGASFPIPEPATWLLGLSGVWALLHRRRAWRVG